MPTTEFGCSLTILKEFKILQRLLRPGDRLGPRFQVGGPEDPQPNGLAGLDVF